MKGPVFANRPSPRGEPGRSRFSSRPRPQRERGRSHFGSGICCHGCTRVSSQGPTGHGWGLHATTIPHPSYILLVDVWDAPVRVSEGNTDQGAPGCGGAPNDAGAGSGRDAVSPDSRRRQRPSQRTTILKKAPRSTCRLHALPYTVPYWHDAD